MLFGLGSAGKELVDDAGIERRRRKIPRSAMPRIPRSRFEPARVLPNCRPRVVTYTLAQPIR